MSCSRRIRGFRRLSLRGWRDFSN